jgi:diguanylate cyclase (GGDEF)-like protein/PAS domain S-box-containing protein
MQATVFRCTIWLCHVSVSPDRTIEIEQSPGNVLLSSPGHPPHQHQPGERNSNAPRLPVEPDPTFDRFTRIATRVTGTPISLLVLDDAGKLWIKSATGTSELIQPYTTIPRSASFSQEVIDTQQPVSIGDTRSRSSWLIERTGIQAYLGVPVTFSDGTTVGSLSVGDVSVRHWTRGDTESLMDIATIVAEELERRTYQFSDDPETTRINEMRRQKERLLESIGEGVYAVDTDGICHFINRAGANLLGYEPSDVIGQHMHELIHHSYADGTPMPREECTIAAATISGDSTSISEHVLWRRDGTPVPVEVTVSPVTERGAVTGSVIRFTDIAENRRQQKQLQESEIRKRAIVESALDPIITIDHEGYILEFNAAAEQTFGYTRDDAIGSLMADLLMPEESRHACLQGLERHLQTGESSVLGQRIERNAMRADGMMIDVEMAVTRIDVDDRDFPIFTAYLRDITDRKKAEASLLLYKHIADAVGESVVASDMDRKIFYANPTAERELGWSIDELHGLDVRDIIPTPEYRDRSTWIGAEVRKTGERISGEFVLRRKTGDAFPALVTLAPIFGEKRELVGTIGIYTDISELKQTEKDLRFHKHAIDAVGQAVIANDLDRHITYMNPAAEELLGWQAEEVLGRDFNEIVPADAFRNTVREIGRRARQGETWNGEFCLRHRDGREIPALSSVRPVFGEDGEIIGVIGAHSDLTEIKETEREIRLYKHLTDFTGQALVANDIDRRIIYWNQAAERMFGWTQEEVLGRDFYDVASTDATRDQMPKIGAQVREGHSWSGEFLLSRKSGESFPILMDISPVLDEDGNPTQIIGAYTEITELKRTEQEIRFFKHTVDAIAEAVVATSLDGEITYLNRAAERMLGWSADELIGRELLTTIPDPAMHENAQEISRYVRTGHHWFGEFGLRRKDGSMFPALVSIAPVTDDAGETSGIISVYTDISELKHAEEDLRFHKHIVDAVGQAVVVSDTAGYITYWNKAAENLYEWTAEEALGQLVFEVLAAPHDTERAQSITETVARGETWAGESPVKKKDGTEFSAYFTVSPIRNSEGEIVGIIGVSHDISEQKEYERQIEFHKIMLDAVGQTIVTTDMNRVITYWSKGAEEALGWTAEEVLGRPIAEIAPAAHLREEAGKLHARVREGNSWQGEFPIRRKDGSTFPAVVTLAPVNLADQGTVGVIGVYTDVSELKETAEELRLHKHMLDAVGQAVCATDENYRVTYWNRAAREMFGYTPSEAIGMHLLDFRPDEVHQETTDILQIVEQTGTWTGEVPLYHKDGTEIAALVSISPISGTSGKQMGITVAMADISARKRIEEDLKDSHEQITEILESMGDGFFSLDADWRFTYINRQGERFLYRSRTELLGRNVWDEFPDDQQRAFFDMYWHTFQTGQPTTFIEYSPGLDSWFEVQAFRSRDQLSVFFRDITQRREREIALREAEHRYRTLVEQLPAMTYIAEPDNVSHITYVSPQIEHMLGYTPEEWNKDPDTWSEHIHPDDHALVVANDEATIREGREQFRLEYRLRAADGSYRWVRDTATLIRDIDGNPSYWQGISYDITEEKRTERAIRENEQRFRSLFENHPDAVFSIDSSGRILSANPAFTTMTGYSLTRRSDFYFVDIVLVEDQGRVQERFTETHNGTPQDLRAGIINLDGRRLELNLTTIPIIVDNDIVGVHVVAQDVTVHQELENQLAHQAFHDALTGLPNRNLFQNRLRDRIEIARRHTNRFAVLFFDLDDFKVINDSLGHSAGDQLLIEVSRRVQTCIRGTDLLARLGGDEFTLLLENVDGPDEAVAIAKRIAEVLDDPFNLDGHELFATTSIGIAIGDQSTASPDDILRNADLAMYEAKNAGKDRYTIFEPSMNSRAWLRLTLEAEIRQGLPQNEFELYYQPIIDLESGEIDGVEALVRWNHPERGFLTPNEFISVAEESGLILPLGLWIIHDATKTLRAWQSLMPDGKPLRLSLNLSPKQYQHHRLVEELTATLTSVDFDPHLITLEITESVAMDDSSETIGTLKQLKDVGVTMALDDFGTGFSALSYLRRFPIDIIKIDQSFVAGLETDLEDTNIVRAVMAASLAMDLKVTAEGIETRQQLAILKEHGCQFGQGYLFARALSAVEMEQLLRAGNLSWQALINEAAATNNRDT